jgi:hypothetical protein
MLLQCGMRNHTLRLAFGGSRSFPGSVRATSVLDSFILTFSVTVGRIYLEQGCIITAMMRISRNLRCSLAQDSTACHQVTTSQLSRAVPPDSTTALLEEGGSA